MRRKKRDYAAYLASPDWHQHRVGRLQVAGRRCEQCGSRRQLQAHHLTYDRVGCEQLEDLEVLCRGCHTLEHGIDMKERKVMASTAETQPATIAEASKTITIRTLAVNGESMTLATYRQLPKDSLVNGDGTFNGEPWGTVNLCPSRECPESGRSAHRHVVWSAAGRLLRDVCRKPPSFDAYSELAGQWGTLAYGDPRYSHLTWKYAEGEHACAVVFVEGLPATSCYVSRKVKDAVDRLRLTPDPPPCTCEDSPYGCKHKRWQEDSDEVKNAYAKALADAAVDNLDQLTDVICDEIRQRHVCYFGRVERWGEITRLPQLFLGV